MKRVAKIDEKAFLWVANHENTQPGKPLPDFLLNFNSHIVPADKFSLPSGHTAAAFLMVTILSLFYPILLIPGLIWASLVGMSRVVLRVHFPIDVIIGALLGTAVALLSFKVLT